MNFSVGDAISLLGILSPLLFPLAAALVGRVVALLPQNRQAQLAQAATIVVHGVEQQSNGGWSNDDKLAAAQGGLTLLAGKFGYKLSANEARLFIESAVALMKVAQGALAPSAPSPVPNGQDLTPPVSVLPQGQDVVAADAGAL
jgi:hypothetical protein